jgi:hypothetical protein
MLSGNLEYITSSLPHLQFSDADTLRNKVTSLLNAYALNTDRKNDLVAILNEEAQKFLTPWEFDTFSNIQLNTVHQSQFQRHNLKAVAAFSLFMHQLKQELYHYRSSKNTNQPESNMRYSHITDLPTDPFRAELYLLKLQWQKLEDLCNGHYANLSALILYKLKLEVLVRWWSFDTETGFQTFQQTLKES